MISRRLALGLAILAGPALLSACADPQPLYVDQAWVRPNPNGEGPAAGYFVIHGGEEPVQLLHVTAEAAQRVEMHESAMQGGRMTMKPVERVDVPAKSEVKFAPGGKHLMIFGLNKAVAESDEMPMTMLFSNGDRLIVTAKIQKAAASDHDTGGGGSH